MSALVPSCGLPSTVPELPAVAIRTSLRLAAGRIIRNVHTEASAPCTTADNSPVASIQLTASSMADINEAAAADDVQSTPRPTVAVGSQPIPDPADTRWSTFHTSTCGRVNLQSLPGPSTPGRTPSTLSNNAGRTGSCAVCKRDRIYIVNTTGLLRQHGPHDNRCKGGRSRPLPGSQRSTLSRPSSSDVDPSQTVTITSTSAATGATLSSQSDILQHPHSNTQILKRIPKGARPAAANLLHKLIRDVLQHPSSTTSWSKFLGFSGACFAKPSRGGKSHNLTTCIVKQVQQYDTSTEPITVPISCHSKQRDKPAKNSDDTLATMASAKLEDGDVKGAVRLLCSDDVLAAQDERTYDKLVHLHPPAPADRRPAPTTDKPPLQVFPAAVKKAIQSFPNGSAAGPDGLRPQHLKDLLVGANDDNPLLMAVTDLINLMLAGGTPTSVRGIIFGANLLAIVKKTGGIRPIAVGYVWRRLAAKVACNHAMGASAAMLAPRQLGFGVSGGAEAAVRAARRYLENMERGKLFIKIDFRNAFNTVRRDTILEAVAKHFPELLQFALSTIGGPSELQFAEFILLSEEGAQQGDPLGPLYFCLVAKEMLESMHSELVLGYLDDVAMGDDASTVLQDFIDLETAAKQLGLTMNREKCEVVGHTDDTRSLFAAHGISLPETNASTVILLGAPLSAGQHLDEVLEGKREELRRLARRLELMPSHDSLYLLRNVLAAPRLMYMLRTAPCTDSPVLPLFDTTIRESLSATLNVDLGEDRWTQASLPVRWGGLGVRSVVSLAPSAYLASAASTATLTSTLLPPRLRDVKDSGIDTAMTAWSRQSANSPATTSSAQRDWDDTCCKIQADILLNNAVDHVARARLLAARSSGSGDWLEALPLQSVGLKMDNATVRIATGLRLGAPIVRPHVCVCGKTVTVDGHHGLSCRHGSGKHSVLRVHISMSGSVPFV